MFANILISGTHLLVGVERPSITLFNNSPQVPKTLLTELHDVQILTFMEGQGVEFYPFSDLGGVRKAFLDDLVERNKLDLRLRLCAHWMMATGGVMLYLRPTGRSYDIRYYDRDGYQAYRDADGELEEVLIRYSYAKRSTQSVAPLVQGQNPNIGGFNGFEKNNQSWVKIRLTKETFERWDYNQKPDFTPDKKSPDVIAQNSLGFIPLVECLNVNNKGEMGKTEYEDLKEEIHDLDILESGIRTNIKELANNILITSLREDQIFESIGRDKDSVAYGSGYRSASDFINPINTTQDGKRLKRVIGGFDRGGDGEAGDFISQVQISPLPPNQLGYVDELSKRLRKALGGRDEREVTYTATEVRSQLGEVSATAAMKERSLFKYGFCVLLEMAILAEENLYLATGGKLGLSTAPSGLNRKVKFRKAPLFIQSAREKLDNSIIGRNNFRAGVGQLEALKDVFPDKSEEELRAMLRGGLPVEYLEDMIRVFSMMQSVFDPATGQPLTASVPIQQYILQALSYGEPDNIDIGTSGPTAALESDSFAAASAAAAKLGLSQPTNGSKPPGKGSSANAVSSGLGTSTATQRTDSIDAEQSLPSSSGVLNDTTGGSSSANSNPNTYPDP